MVIIIMGLVLISVGLIVAGLLLMQQKQTPLTPMSRSPGPELAPATDRSTLPELYWKRPLFIIPLTLTTWNAVLYMIIGLVGIGNFILSLSFSIWLGFFPGTCDFIFLVGGGLIFSLGLRDWQRIQALEARGQMTQGVIFDRWVSGGRRTAYCVAYYFDLPWGSPDGSRIIRTEVNQQVYRAFQVGDSVPIRYLPDKPQVCRVER